MSHRRKQKDLKKLRPKIKKEKKHLRDRKIKGYRDLCKTDPRRVCDTFPLFNCNKCPYAPTEGGE